MKKVERLENRRATLCRVCVDRKGTELCPVCHYLNCDTCRKEDKTCEDCFLKEYYGKEDIRS